MTVSFGKPVTKSLPLIVICLASVSGTAGAPSAGGDSSTPILIDEDHQCDGASFELTADIPSLMVLVDRSSSMFDVAFGTSTNRWEPLKSALVGDGVLSLGVLGDLQHAVRFGFAAFTSQQADAARCPNLVGSDVPVALNNYAAVKEAYDAASYDPILDGGGLDLTYAGETPTGESVGVAAAALAALTQPGPKYLLLVVDGQPDTCGLFNPQCGQDVSVTAVQNAFAQGIQTFVLGIEMTDFEGARHLTQLANAGMGMSVEQGEVFPNCEPFLSSLPGGGTTAEYSSPMGNRIPYLPQNASQLVQAVTAIIRSVRSCNLELTSISVDSDLAAAGQVQLGDRLLTYGAVSGWELVGTNTIRLNGAACDEFRATSHPFVAVGYPCDAVTY